MYPQRELSRLAGHKTVLVQRIMRRRLQTARTVEHVLRPVVRLDEILALARRLAPVLAVPLASLVARIVSRRAPRLRAWIQWTPIVFGLVQRLNFHRAPSRAAAAPFAG